MAGRLFLIVLGFVTPILMLELGVRLAKLAPPSAPNPAIWEPHPLFGWWHVPHSGGIFHSEFNEFEAEVRINARGLRDREIGYDNPDEAIRILSLADSFGEALQVDLEETYHKQLEALLVDSLGRPVEVINAGVGGWGTDQEAIFYVAEGFRYEPDIVLLSFFIRNDAVNNYGPLEIARNGGSQRKAFFELSETGELIAPSVEPVSSGPVEAAQSKELSESVVDLSSGPDYGSELEDPLKAEPPLLDLARYLWETSALYRYVTPHLRTIPSVVQGLGPSGILGGEAVIRARHPATPVPFFVYQSPPDERFETAWRLTEAIITRLQTEVESRGARLVVILIGAPEQISPEAWEQTVAHYPAMRALTWDLDAPNRRLNRFLDSQNIPYLDLVPIFRRAARQRDGPALHFRHDQHWTPAGHRLAATAIQEFLLDALSEEFER